MGAGLAAQVFWAWEFLVVICKCKIYIYINKQKTDIYIYTYPHTPAYIQTCAGTYIHIGMASCPGSGEKYTDPTWNPIEARSGSSFVCVF